METPTAGDEGGDEGGAEGDCGGGGDGAGTMLTTCCTSLMLMTVTMRAGEIAAGVWAAIAVATELEAAALDVRMVASTLIEPAEIRRVICEALMPANCAARLTLKLSCLAASKVESGSSRV